MYDKELVKPSAPTPPSVDVDQVMRQALLSSHSLMCFEVALPAEQTAEFTILELGEGARNLLSHAPWGTCTGSNMLHFIHHDDADNFISFLQRRAGPALSVAKDESSNIKCAEDTIKESTAWDTISVRLRRFSLHRFATSERPSERPSFHRPAALGCQQDAAARSQDRGPGAGEPKTGENCAVEGVPDSFAFPEVLADDPLLEDVSQQVFFDVTMVHQQLQQLQQPQQLLAVLLTLKTQQEPDATMANDELQVLDDNDRPANSTLRTFSFCDYINVDVSMHSPVKS